jgi:transposase InsO family protein
VCWDNAQQGSLWYTLETEFHDRYSFATRAEAIEAVNRWIDTVCNTCRRHSALGQISPLQFETQYTTAAQEAAQPDVHENGSTPQT